MPLSWRFDCNLIDPVCIEWKKYRIRAEIEDVSENKGLGMQDAINIGKLIFYEFVKCLMGNGIYSEKDIKTIH